MTNLYQIVLLFVPIVVLIYLSGWFSGTETALTSLTAVNLVEMRKIGAKNIEYILQLKRTINRTLVAILIGNNIVNVLLSALVAIVANEMFNAIGVSIAIGLITFLIIVFGEITPKSYAIHDAEKIASNNARMIYLFMQAINPLISLFVIISRTILGLIGIKTKSTKLIVTDESIMGMATLGRTEGSIKGIESDIIHKVFSFGDKLCVDVMVPLAQVYYLNEGMTFNEATHNLVEHGFTRVPILNKKNRVVAILYSKDLIGKKRGSVELLGRKPIVFSVKSHITHVFSVMKKKRIHMAVVKNMHGKHVGIITLEDILEEIVGGIYDEYYNTKYKLGGPGGV